MEKLHMRAKRLADKKKSEIIEKEEKDKTIH